MEKINKIYLYLIVGLISFAVFYNTFQNQFVFDDESVVQNNQSIQSLSNIPKFFSADEGFHKVIGRYYRPVVSTTYALDYAVWKLDPKGFHITNVLIHVIAALLLFSILLKLFGEYKYGVTASFLGALLFAVHPVHTEAVSWISGRTDSLVSLFFFASFLYYLKFVDDSKEEGKINKYLILSLVFYLIGLLSKEMIITMPVMIILFDYIYKGKKISELRKNLTAYLLFAAVSLLYLGIRYFVLKDVPERMKYMYFDGKDTATAFFTMINTIPVYFRLLFAPINLLYHYNGVMPDATSFSDTRFIFSAIFILLLLSLSFYYFRKSGEITFSILFFLVSLLPVLNIIPTMNFMAERFLYMTSFVLSVFVCYVFIKYISEKNKTLFIGVLGLVLIVFVFMTWQRNKEWKDNDTLYSTADGIDGNVLLVNAGNIYANKKNYTEAEKRYRRAIEIRDNSLLAHHNLGLIFLLKGNPDSAEIKFKKGISIDSLAPDGYFMLSNLYQQQGRVSEAITQLEKLQTILPDYRGTMQTLAMLKSKEIIPDTTANIQYPDGLQSSARIQLLEKSSFANYQNGKYEQAIIEIKELIKLNPTGTSGFYNNLALCYEGLGKTEDAEKSYLEALKTDTKNTSSMNGLSGIYLKKDNKAKAIEYLKKILELNPSDQTAKYKLDSLAGLKN